MRLSPDVTLPDGFIMPRYDRGQQKPGIVHFGIGAFHRAHQAVYTDDAMNAGDRDWGIIGVSMRSANVAEQLNPQDGLYTVTARASDSAQTRLIGAVQQVLVASTDRQAVIDAIAAPSTHIISFTITEKGYQRGEDGSFPAFCDLLAEAFEQRCETGLSGVTLLTCDNLAHNGAKLNALMRDALNARDPALSAWFAAHCTCPSTMVDRIVPATTDADRILADGLRDEAAVITEPFSQWVIEDNFAGPRPRWELGGAEFVTDVAPYETAKLRMLNGAHSALAYIGLAHGHEFVHQAIADPAIRPLIETLMRHEAATSIIAAPNQDLTAYADALIARFANSALDHRLIQIAMDGSQKIPQRWLETLQFHQSNTKQCPAILTALAAWCIHIGGANGPVDDPMADRLCAAVKDSPPEQFLLKLFAPAGIVDTPWQPTPDDIVSISRQYASLYKD